MALASLFTHKAPPKLEELDVVGSGAFASSVVRARVLDCGGFSRLTKGQIVAVKKVFVPRHRIIAEQRRARLERRNQRSALGCAAAGDEVLSSSEDETRSFDVAPLHATPLEADDSHERNRCVAIEREVSLLKSLSHPNIVSCYGAVALEQNSMLGIVMEYCAGNNLRHFYSKLRQCSEGGDLHRIPDDMIRSFTAQIVVGLAYLHNSGVVHRDLKGLNVLLSEDFRTCKLADFGSAVRLALSGTDARFHSMQGTIWWMAPEQFLLGPVGSTEAKRRQQREQLHDAGRLDDDADFSNTDAIERFAGGTLLADVWSLGCTVLELATGEIPFHSVQGGQFGLAMQLTRSTFHLDDILPPSTVASLSPDVMRFIRRCLVRDASKRPSVAELLSDPWIEGALQPSPRLASKLQLLMLHPTPMGSTNAFTATSQDPVRDDDDMCRVVTTLIQEATPCSTISSSPESSALPTSVSSFSDKKPAKPAPFVPDFVAKKLHAAALFWFHMTDGDYDGVTTIDRLCTRLQAPSLASVIAPLFRFPVPVLPSSFSRSCEEVNESLSGSTTINFLAFLQFMQFFGPLEAFVADVQSLERDSYASSGYSNYGRYAQYETTDCSHLLLSCLSKPYVALTLTQTETEDKLKHALPGTFIFRYSSKSSTEAPGSLTLSVKSDHAVMHHRILRPADGWSFLMTLPSPMSKLRNSAASNRHGADNTAQQRTLCFDTIEDLVAYFVVHGIPSQRSDRVYKLRP